MYSYIGTECDLNSVSYELVLESAAVRQDRFPWEETVKASINIRLVRIGLVISVDWEHGTGMDHIAPAPTTYPMIYVSHITMLACIKRIECHQSVNVCV
jgi:hypothetical protein